MIRKKIIQKLINFKRRAATNFFWQIEIFLELQKKTKTQNAWFSKNSAFFKRITCFLSHCKISSFKSSIFQDFAKTWASESTCYQLAKPRQFPVETLGVDKSESALQFGKKAGIFDKTQALDMNNLSESEAQSLKEQCHSANILTMNSLGYIQEDQINKVILDYNRNQNG